MQAIQLPVSKSVLIRKLFIDYLYFNEIPRVENTVPEDVRIVFRNLLLVKRFSSEKNKKQNKIDVRDCGAAFRLFTALLAVTEGEWLLTGTARLLQRPIVPLVEALNSIGAEISQADKGLTIHGKRILSEKISIDTSLSSQFLTALLLVSNKIGLKRILLKNSFRPSFSYIGLTCEMLREIGVFILIDDSEIRVKSGELRKIAFHNEADWSAAAFWYATALLTGKSMFIKDLSVNSAQPDRNLIAIFGPLGIQTREMHSGICIIPDSHRTSNRKISLNLQDNPDLAPILAAAFVLLGRPCEISGLSTLNNKESRRLQVLKEELGAFAKIKITDNEILDILPRASFPECGGDLVFNAHRDHRMVMAFSLFSYFYDVKIEGFSSVRKSYPGFGRLVAANISRQLR